MWTQLGHHACSLSVRGIQNLKTAQSERPRLMSKNVERVFVPRLNSPNRRLWNGRRWREAVIRDPGRIGDRKSAVGRSMQHICNTMNLGH
jgi:hypothetical protein